MLGIHCNIFDYGPGIQSIGGILISLVLRHCDAVLKGMFRLEAKNLFICNCFDTFLEIGIATSVALILSLGIEYVCLGRGGSLWSLTGAMLVVGSSIVYMRLHFFAFHHIDIKNGTLTAVTGRCD